MPKKEDILAACGEVVKRLREDGIKVSFDVTAIDGKGPEGDSGSVVTLDGILYHSPGKKFGTYTVRRGSVVYEAAGYTCIATDDGMVARFEAVTRIAIQREAQLRL